MPMRSSALADEAAHTRESAAAAQAMRLMVMIILYRKRRPAAAQGWRCFADDRAACIDRDQRTHALKPSR
jgi:hypothetical protein